MAPMRTTTPAASEAAATDTCSAPLPLPLAGLTLSQLPPLEVAAVAVQLSVPPPELEIDTLCGAGFCPAEV